MRHRRHRHHAGKAGQPPGTLSHLRRDTTEKASISVLRYDADRVELETGLGGWSPGEAGDSTVWVRVCGLHDSQLLEAVGESFGIHPLVLEDIMNTEQRPKLEDYGDYLFLTLRAFGNGADPSEGEQVSLILGKGFVISFQEKESELFEPVLGRLENSHSRIRRMGADYLVYSLLDTVVDFYFLVLESLGERLEDLEEGLVVKPGQDALQEIHDLKLELLYFRKALWPLREVIGRLGRNESSLITADTGVYVRDVYDHAIQAIDTLETYRDIVSGMLDIYLSSVSNRMNQIMKVLTIISTVFIPLTFIAGVYGMNFKYMPELEQPWGYPSVLVLMLSIVLGMMVFFRRQRWI